MESYVTGYVIAFIGVLVFYICYELHQEVNLFCYLIYLTFKFQRKRNGKPGIPLLGMIFDSISVSVREEILDEACDNSANEASSRSEKKKKHRKHKHKNHRCSKKRHRKSKSKEHKPVKTPVLELMEEPTQRSDRSDQVIKAKTPKVIITLFSQNLIKACFRTTIDSETQWMLAKMGLLLLLQ